MGIDKGLKHSAHNNRTSIFVVWNETWFPATVTDQKQVIKLHKYAARLVTNNFSCNITYGELLKTLKWQPIHHTVATRRLLNLRKYLEDIKSISNDIFIPKLPTSDRRSQRLCDKRPTHNKQLATTTSRNAKTASLAIAQSITMWNSLKQELVDRNYKEFETNLNENIMLELQNQGLLIDTSNL
jgi:hypothetical protein